MFEFDPMNREYDAQSRRVKEQYKDDNNLAARINLHKYNTNKIDWNVWFFNKMDIPEKGRILELGCGNGVLWQRNINSIREGWDIILSDFSEGMLQSAKQNIDIERIKYKIIDIQDIPYENESFDIIIARHMLYHVPDIDKALSEVKRLLKPKGRFYVSTNGREHMRELVRLVRDYDKDISFDPEKLAVRFGVENGAEILYKHFNNVTLEEFNGQIIVDEAEPIVSYVTSVINARKTISAKHGLEDFYKYVQAEIDKQGALRIRTRTGIMAVI
jgi:ubiquinone/menaquinone biosynthesis C-methylase UbiE